MQPRRDIARRNVAGILTDLLRAGPRLDVRRRRRPRLFAGDLLDRAMGAPPSLQRVERRLFWRIAIEVEACERIEALDAVARPAAPRGVDLAAIAAIVLELGLESTSSNEA